MSDDDAKAGSTNSQCPVWLLDPYEVPIELRWRWLGPVTAADHPRFTGALRLTVPKASSLPGVYCIKVILGDQYRLYIGQGANLNKRIQEYAGKCENKLPAKVADPTLNMKYRLWRIFTAGGKAEVFELDSCNAPEASPVMLERIAIVAAYLRKEPLINERGYPEFLPDDPFF